jgi:hypothetical protein
MLYAFFSYIEAATRVPAEYFTDTYVFNWRNQTFRADLILILPIAVCLGTGLWLHHPAVGMIAASGAMTVGFGAKQSIDESRLLLMLFVTLGMAFAAFLGVVIGHTNFFVLAVAALWGFGYGMLTTREAGYSWVGQQCVITFLVASAFPASVEAAGDRALLIFAGGVLQILSSTILLRAYGELGALRVRKGTKPVQEQPSPQQQWGYMSQTGPKNHFTNIIAAAIATAATLARGSNRPRPIASWLQPKS